MLKAIGILAAGIGLVLVADNGVAQAQPHRADRFSRGVHMKCRVASGACSFKNDRARPRMCSYSVNYVTVHPHRGKRHRTHSGRVMVHGGARVRHTFYAGRSQLRRITSVWFECRGRRYPR